MSSIASTSRPPVKRARYSNESSSYSTFHPAKASTPSRKEATAARREAEVQAAAELEAQRQASRQRVLNVWESLERRYSRALDQDDIVDLEKMTVIQDSGTLKAIRDVPFGSLAAPEPGEGGSESEDDDDDELATWDDERHSALPPEPEVKIQRWKPPPLTEEDKRDLDSFLRAEQVRREEQGWLDERDHESVEYVEETEEEPAYAPHQRNHKEEDESEEEADDARTEENQEEEEDEDSVSSFRPSEERQTVSESDSEESEDELGQRTQTSSPQLRPQSPPRKAARSRPPIHIGTSAPSRHPGTGTNSSRKPAAVHSEEESEQSSEDDLGDSEEQRELEIIYIRAKTVDPTGRRSISPVKRSNLSPIKPVSPIESINSLAVETSTRRSISPFKRISPVKPVASSSTKPPSTKRSLSVSPVKLISLPRYGNPQLSTPPRSKSSVFSSTPDDILRASSVARSESVARNAIRQTSVVNELERAKHFGKPEVVLGKRKRVSSPLSSPTQRGHWDEDSRAGERRTQLHFDVEGEDSGDDSPDPLDSVLDEDEVTPSKNSYRGVSERPLSPLARKAKRHSTEGPSLSGRAQETGYSVKREEARQREESVTPADLSQLVFHLRKVNEWVKNHHVEDLLDDEPFPSSSASTSTSRPPSSATSNATPSKRIPQISGFPHLTPRKSSSKDEFNFITPKNSHRTMSSLPGSVSSSVRSVRSTSSAMGPPPTPTRLFQSSPLKPASSQPSISGSSHTTSGKRRVSFDEGSERFYRFADEDEDQPSSSHKASSSRMQRLPARATSSAIGYESRGPSSSQRKDGRGPITGQGRRY